MLWEVCLISTKLRLKGDALVVQGSYLIVRANYLTHFVWHTIVLNYDNPCRISKLVGLDVINSKTNQY